ncbi:MAG: hypothetical protein JXR52_02005 [Bacteroidales bacterium]|nr:hypothetical protein [Bacteroidales bacterium]MBN2697574.1 hypothetical protein [Bacteroidales bacterium]
MNQPLRFFTFLLPAIIACHTNGQISGTITVNPDGSGDYPSIQSAVDDLVSQGVSGPTEVALAPGTYSGMITIPEIPGTSGQNRVTFTSSTGNPEDVILTDSIASDVFSLNRGHIKLEYADCLTFKNLTIITHDESSFGSTFTFFGGTDHPTAAYCLLDYKLAVLAYDPIGGASAKHI